VPRGRSRRAMQSGLRVKGLCVVLVNPDVVANRGLIGKIELVEADVTIQRIEHVEPFPRGAPTNLGHERLDAPAPASACGEFLNQRLHGGKVVGNGLGAFRTVKEVSKVRR
jgi:hypothetical protein